MAGVGTEPCVKGEVFAGLDETGEERRGSWVALTPQSLHTGQSTFCSVSQTQTSTDSATAPRSGPLS